MFYIDSNRYLDKNWIETDETDPVKVIEAFYYKNCYIYDADVCGNETVEFAFEVDGKIEYYKLSYSWSMNYIFAENDEDEDEGWSIENDYEITKIENPETKFPGNRDWLTLSEVWPTSLR